MKAIRILSSMALLVALTAGLASACPLISRNDRLGEREHLWQAQRFENGQRFGGWQGQRWGRHTWREEARLRAARAQIRRMERLARADGHVSLRERAMIRRMKLQLMRQAFGYGFNGRSV